MKNVSSLKLIPLALVIALVFSGCTGRANKTNGGATGAAAPVATEKAPLVIPKEFESPRAKRDFALKAVQNGYYKEAQALLQQSAQENPDSVTFGSLGTAHYMMDNKAGAVDAWTKAMEMDSKLTGEMLNNIGNVLRDQGKYDEAFASYRKALEVEPTRWTAAINMAGVLKDQGKLAEAVAVLESALPANKDVPDVQHLLDSYKQELKTASTHKS